VLETMVCEEKRDIVAVLEGQFEDAFVLMMNEPSEDNRIGYQNCYDQLAKALVDGGLTHSQSVSLVDALAVVSQVGLWL
jgi:hypothetical protein